MCVCVCQTVYRCLVVVAGWLGTRRPTPDDHADADDHDLHDDNDDDPCLSNARRVPPLPSPPAAAASNLAQRGRPLDPPRRNRQCTAQPTRPGRALHHVRQENCSSVLVVSCGRMMKEGEGRVSNFVLLPPGASPPPPSAAVQTLNLGREQKFH